MFLPISVKDNKKLKELTESEITSLLSIINIELPEKINRVVIDDGSDFYDIFLKIKNNNIDLSKLYDKIRKGNVYYKSEEPIEHYFKILGVYRYDDYRSNYLLKMMVISIFQDEFQSIRVSYIELESFLEDNDEFLFLFGNRLPTTIETKMMDFINSMKNE